MSDGSEIPTHLGARTPSARRLLLVLALLAAGVALIVSLRSGDDPLPPPADPPVAPQAPEGPGWTAVEHLMRRLTVLAGRSSARLVVVPGAPLSPARRDRLAATRVLVGVDANGHPLRLSEALTVPGASAPGVLPDTLVLAWTGAEIPDGVRGVSATNPFEALAALLHHLNEGHAPRLFVWQVDLTLLESDPEATQRVAVMEAVVDATEGWSEFVGPDALTATRGATESGDGTWVATEPVLELKLPRPVPEPSHLVLYLRRSEGADSPLWFGIEDPLRGDRRATCRHPVSSRPNWQRLLLPVPWGDQPLTLRIEGLRIGETVHCARPGFLPLIPFDGGKALVGYRPETIHDVLPDGGLGTRREVGSLTLEGLESAGAAVDRSAHLAFAPLPTAGSQVYFAFGVLATEAVRTRLPVTYIVGWREGDLFRHAARAELWTAAGSWSTGSVVLLAPPSYGPETRLEAHVFVTSAVAGQVAAAVVSSTALSNR